ncbi:hypothetical protein AX768_03680 [Burkholderia sp. PAMC 28687]|uniref:hypothetical protein n=1 Tax=Burkholderia sp. PAMC 28687 TaxID=1795874 RepID=UPI000784F4FF|nr:hypothetical protein [Burkholderia sp. PAMC 28687]AMM13344.1 hypothetical protein AX768_03680 [Burkholderia sp. PAMC 28687]
MNKYLDRLKPSKHPSVSFVSGVGEHIEKRDSAFVSSVSTMGERLEKNDAPSVSFVSEPGGRIPKIDSDEIPTDCIGALLTPAGNLYLPWGPQINSQTLREWRDKLALIVADLASLEGWRPEDRSHVIECIYQQPASTLRGDLKYFRLRLEKARAETATGKERHADRARRV